MMGLSSLVRVTAILSWLSIINHFQIVEKYSALLEVSHEEQIPVDADHRAMCRFETDSDVTFEKVYKRIKRMSNNPPRMAIEQSGMSS